MDQLYREVSDKLLEELKRYRDNEITHDELFEAFEHEDLVYRHKEWSHLENKYKTKVFESQLRLNKHLLDIEKNIAAYETLNKNEEIEINTDSLFVHANMLSRNREPPEGFEHSIWYLPPFPNLNMVEHLHGEEE